MTVFPHPPARSVIRGVPRAALHVLLVLGLLMAALGYGAASAAPSATITVTTTADTLDAAAGNCAAITIAGLPGPDGVTSLREAVCAANNSPGSTITFGVNGTFTLTRTGVNEDAAATGDLDLLSNVTITGKGATNTIIDGNNSDRIFDIDPLQGSNAVVSISGVTIQHGSVNPAAINLGGGVATGGSSTVTISNSTITANQSVSGTGGGLEAFGALTLTNVTVSNNIADAQGGGIRATGNTTISGSTITGNSSEVGGGLWLGSASGISMSVTESTISGNHAVDRPGGLGAASEDGGGLYIDTDGSVTIQRSTISGNDASRNGGGIYFRDNPSGSVGSLGLTNNTI
ncbi:MAG TPA: right-handed parallel beta-helix repeat-containing protein, partial [Chloroflexia bacterium]